MNRIRPIRTDDDLHEALERMADLWGAVAGTPDGDDLEILADLIEAYERKYALPPGDPIAVIKYKLEELGISQRELGRRLGWSAGRVSEVLGRKRELTAAMVRKLSTVLGVPAGVFLGEAAPTEGATVTLPESVAVRVRMTASRRGVALEEEAIALVEFALGQIEGSPWFPTVGTSSGTTDVERSTSGRSRWRDVIHGDNGKAAA